MYQINEKKLNMLLVEGTSLLDRLSHSRGLTTSEVQHFGNALLDVQTEVHRQDKTQDNGLYKERLQA